MYKTTTYEDTVMIFNILKKKFPSHTVNIRADNGMYIITHAKGESLDSVTIPLFIKIKIIYGDTDSIFTSIQFNRNDYTKNRLDTFKLASNLADTITSDLFNRKPIQLEFEKVFQPFILLTKKRYIGKKFSDLRDPFKLKEITKSGIAITRRDYCQVVKNCYNEVIDCIVNDSDTVKSVQVYKKYLDDIFNYKIDMDLLVVSALLAKTYKTKPVHVQLCEKLKVRKEEVQIGDRIPYVYIEDTSGLKLQKSELGEDPVYAKENGLKYNRSCYIDQLSKPLLGFFKCILDSEELKELDSFTNELLRDSKKNWILDYSVTLVLTTLKFTT